MQKTSNTDSIEVLKLLLIQKLMNKESLCDNDISQLANQLGSTLLLSSEEIESAIKYVQSRLITTMNEGVSLINQNVIHNENWYKNGIPWDYWNDYYQYLKVNDMHPRVVNSLGDVTAKILGLLKNPDDPGEWDRRGLVIGHVQSGKTANYIGLLTRAADAGYKVIIVIAGIHNNLRKQTQERIDEGFVGRDSTPDGMKMEIGVGLLNKNRRLPFSLTSTAQDFNKKNANGVMADLQGSSRPVVVVIKKNVTTLKTLYSWLKDLNARGKSQQIADIPMLMIDDEADNASINTKKADLDPTKTNEYIRKILTLFKKRCYVGYTATPFANIFINPDTVDEMLHSDLFPEDFIYCLDAPTNYLGAQRIFIDEDTSSDFLISIDDAEPYFPITHKTKDFPVSDIPKSLKKAINLFVLGRAVRILRDQEKKHASMMVNVSRFVEVQKQIREIISCHVQTMARSIRYNYSHSVEKPSDNSYLSDLKTSFEEEFFSINEKWSDIETVLSKVLDEIKVIVVNAKSDDTLDYKKYNKNKESLTVIAVGGLSLSRGLTLEGLMISYMYRNTKMYDTLMQMGRWFGYREGYEDLCRIFLSDESQNWYCHITESIEELRLLVKKMRRDGMSPKNFGLYVRAHPDALKVTARNKMLNTETRQLQISYNGKLIETHIVPSKKNTIEDNQKIFKNLFSLLCNTLQNKMTNIDGSFFWADVNWEIIDDFISKFKFHKSLFNEKISSQEYLQKISDKYPNVDVAFISLKKEKKDQTLFYLSSNTYILPQNRTVASVSGADGTLIPKIPDSEDGYYITSKDRVASRGVEIIGLNSSQINEAEELARIEDVKISDKHYRAVRRKPLLILHILNLRHEKIRNSKKFEKLVNDVPAIGLAFPDGDYSTSVNYVVNKVWLKQGQNEDFDIPEDEEDYDA